MSTDDGELARVIPLHGRRSSDLVTVLRTALADKGAVNEDLVPGEVTPKLWRATARKAARELGRPVRTGQVDHEDVNVVTVWAGLTDWPRDPGEQAITTASMRRTVEAVAAAFPLPRD